MAAVPCVPLRSGSPTGITMARVGHSVQNPVQCSEFWGGELPRVRLPRPDTGCAGPNVSMELPVDFPPRGR
jgi:hypothetical protein